MMSPRFGDVGEYLFGAATVAALVWAVLETRRSRDATVKAHHQTERALAMQASRDQFERDARVRAQAALIACAITPAPLNLEFRMWNHSPVPIFDVKWFIVSGVRTVHSAGPDEAVTIGPGTVHGTTSVVSLNLASRLDRLTGITFRDNAGVNWVKWSDGLLELRSSDLTAQIAGEAAWARGGARGAE